MGKLLTFIAYAVYLLFCARVVFHAIAWMKAPGQQTIVSEGVKINPFRVLASAAIDLLLFRRLFRTNRLLWLASWTFHVSFVLILVRHAWYFMNPVPDIIIFMQPAGIAGGHMLPFSLLILFIIKVTDKKDRYMSFYNVFLTILLFAISVSGLLMRYVFQTDLIEVKDFITGILTFTPDILPDSAFFIMHFVLVLLLIPNIPFHLFAVPVVTVDAKRREEEREMILHEK